jgi:hypothetical protein
MADMDYNRRNKAPRALSEREKEALEEYIDSIHYSARLVLILHRNWTVGVGVRRKKTNSIL